MIKTKKIVLKEQNIIIIYNNIIIDIYKMVDKKAGILLKRILLNK